MIFIGGFSRKSVVLSENRKYSVCGTAVFDIVLRFQAITVLYF